MYAGVMSKLWSSSNLNKEDMILCIMELSRDEGNKEQGTKDWMNLLDTFVSQLEQQIG